MTAQRLVLVAALVLCATTARAQSHGALLEQAIFAEDTAGDVDGAIRLYERLSNSQGIPNQLAAIARARLSEAHARRDQQMQLAAHADQSQQRGQPGRVDPPAPQPAPRTPVATGSNQSIVPAVVDGCCGWWSNNYDPNRPIVVSGTITFVQWMNPLTVLELQGSDGNRWGFTLNPPNAMIRQGINKDSLKAGDAVTVNGFLALGTTEGCQGPLPHACATLADGALHASGSIVTSNVDGRRIFNRMPTEDEQKREAQSAAVFRLDGTMPSVQFHNASVREILVSIGRMTGVNVMFDHDYVDPRPYSLDVKNVTLEQAFAQVTAANQLSYKMLDPHTILVSNDNPQKR